MTDSIAGLPLTSQASPPLELFMLPRSRGPSAWMAKTLRPLNVIPIPPRKGTESIIRPVILAPRRWVLQVWPKTEILHMVKDKRSAPHCSQLRNVTLPHTCQRPPQVRHGVGLCTSPRSNCPL